MRYGEEPAACIEAKRKPALFVVTVRLIIDRQSQGIQEYRGSLIEGDVVLVRVRLGLGGVPEELEYGSLTHGDSFAGLQSPLVSPLYRDAGRRLAVIGNEEIWRQRLLRIDAVGLEVGNAFAREERIVDQELPRKAAGR